MNGTSNEKEIICIYLAIDPQGQGDLQDHIRNEKLWRRIKKRKKRKKKKLYENRKVFR